MNSAATRFLPPRARALALPSRLRPQLYLMSESPAQRWRHSALYPAFRTSAKAYRVALRLKAALGVGGTRQTSDGVWALREYLRDCLPGVKAAVVLLGTPGPAQKVTVQLWEGRSVIGYLKYAETPAAKVRLEQEHAVLTRLPADVGQRPIKYGPFDEGQALVTTPVQGHPLPARLPLRSDLRAYLGKLYQGSTWPLELHPWVVRFRERFETGVEPLFVPLSGRSWPVVFQHGDLAPWNVLRRANGTLTAIDWEYGDAQGFPHLDAAHYMLQVAALMLRWPPERTRAYATFHLHPTLTVGQADALVRLAAFAAYQDARVDGHEPDTPLQVWRRTVWKEQ